MLQYQRWGFICFSEVGKNLCNRKFHLTVAFWYLHSGYRVQQIRASGTESQAGVFFMFSCYGAWYGIMCYAVCIYTFLSTFMHLNQTLEFVLNTSAFLNRLLKKLKKHFQKTIGKKLPCWIWTGSGKKGCRVIWQKWKLSFCRGQRSSCSSLHKRADIRPADGLRNAFYGLLIE